MANSDYRNEMREVRREATWTIFHWIPTVILILIVLMGLGWFVQGNEFFMYKFWAPKQEQVRREVFEQTKSYKQGTIQNLRRMQEEYVRADDAHKDSLSSIILHTADDVPEVEMPNDLKAFIGQLKTGRGLR